MNRCTLIIIGVGREAITDSYTDPTTFYLSKASVGAENGSIVDVSEPHAKTIINFTCDVPPTDAVRGLILRYPHLRFVLYYEGDGVRGTLQGRKGIVTKEVVRDDKPAWIHRKTD